MTPRDQRAPVPVYLGSSQFSRRKFVSRASALGLSVPALGAFLAACGEDDGGGSSGGGSGGGGDEDPFKVAWINIGPKTDNGWTMKHDEGRKFVEQELPWVATTFLETIPDAEAGQAAERLIADGNKMIFGTSFGQGEGLLQSAAKHPDVFIEHAVGRETAENLSVYYGVHWSALYLVGMIAGRMTKSNKIGAIMAFPINDVIIDVNSFTLGAQSVNPDVETQVVVVNTWFDPPTEKQAARSLADAGCDVLWSVCDSPAAVEEAESRGIYAASWNADHTRFGPKAFLSSVVWNWGPRYVERVKAARDGTWTSEDWWGTLKDGTVELAPYGESVPDDVRAEVDARLEEVTSESFDPFAGPIRDQNGETRVSDGDALSFEQQLAWDWYVEGVKGV